MTSSTVDFIRHYEVDSTPGLATFVAGRQFPYSGDYREKIRQLAEIDEQGGTKHKEPGEITVDTHDHHGESDELNIHLGRTQGKVAIAINLPRPAGESSLEYAEPLTVESPSNFADAQPFLQSAEICPAGGSRWASFVIDLNELRQTPLARRIIDQALSHGKLPVMQIPYSLNIWDRELGFSPWMIPDHHHDKSIRLSADAEAGTADFGILSHDGVHPKASYIVSVILI